MRIKTLKKGQIVFVKGKEVILSSDITIDYEKKGYFILDLDNQCNYPNLDVLPAQYIECGSMGEIYELYKYNVVLGKVTDLCLI